MESKCEISGVKFEVSPQEQKLIGQNKIAFPRRAETERLRYFLATVPDLSACTANQSLFSIMPSNNYLPSVNIRPLVPVKFTPDRFPNLTGESCFSRLVDLFQYWSTGAKADRKERVNESIPNYCSYDCSNIYDTSFSYESEYLVNCFFVNKCKRLYSARYSINCSDSYYIENCENCTFCLFSTNLKDKKYHVFNQEVSVDEYHKVLESLLLSDPLHLENSNERFANFLKTQGCNVSSFYRSQDVSGRFLYESKNVRDAYLSCSIANSALIFGGYDINDSAALFLSGGEILNSYQCSLLSGPAKGIRNSYLCGPNISELDYCIGCKNSSNLMFCVGLENVSHCILNQQLTEQEYLSYRDQVKKIFALDIDWGKQLPSQVSMIGYNESLANLFFPLSKVQANILGFGWNENLDLFNIDRESKKISICEISGETFKISDLEIRIRTKLGLAPPTRAPGQRFRDLIASAEFGPRKQGICGISSKLFSHYYRGTRLVLS